MFVYYFWHFPPKGRDARYPFDTKATRVATLLALKSAISAKKRQKAPKSVNFSAALYCSEAAKKKRFATRRPKLQ